MEKGFAMGPALAALLCGLSAALGALCLCVMEWQAPGWALLAISLLAVQALGSAHDRAALARRRGERKARRKAAVKAAGTIERKAA